MSHSNDIDRASAAVIRAATDPMMFHTDEYAYGERSSWGSALTPDDVNSASFGIPANATVKGIQVMIEDRAKTRHSANRVQLYRDGKWVVDRPRADWANPPNFTLESIGAATYEPDVGNFEVH